MNDKKREETFDFFNSRLQFILPIVGVVVAIFNIWFMARIAPLAKDITVLAVQVQAAQDDINQVKTETITRNEWNTRNSLIDNALGRIEGKIDNLLSK